MSKAQSIGLIIFSIGMGVLYLLLPAMTQTQENVVDVLV
jgi:hypothetical protein